MVATEKELARLAGTTQLGTTLGEIIRALRKKPLSATKARLTTAQLSRHPASAILLVSYGRMGPLSHAILFEGFDDGYYKVIDPLSGSNKLTTPQLEHMWQGHAILIEDNPPG